MNLPPENQERLASSAISVPLNMYRGLSYRLTRKSSTKSDRENAVKYCLQLTPGITQVLKTFVELGRTNDFDQALSDWNRATDHADLQTKVQDLLELVPLGNPEEHRLADEATELAAVASDVEVVESARTKAIFELGAWTAHLAKADGDPMERFGAYLIPLANAISEADVVQILNSYGTSNRFEQIESWHRSEQIGNGIHHWTGDGSGFALFWAAVLLLRASSPEQTPGFFASPTIVSTERELAFHLAELERDLPRWERLMQGDWTIEQRLASLRSGLQSAVQEQERLDANRLATAELSQEIVAEFVRSNEAAFLESQRLVTYLRSHGRVDDEVNRDAFGDDARGIHELVPKSFFVGGNATFIDPVFGEELARDQDALLFRLLVEATDIAEETESEGLPIDAIEDTIETFRRRLEGPIALLAPDTPYVRRSIFAVENFEPDRTTSSTKFGQWSGSDVILIPGTDLSNVVVFTLDEVRVTVFESEPGVPMRLEVRQVTEIEADRIVQSEVESQGLEPPHEDARRLELLRERAVVDARANIRVDAHPGDRMVLKFVPPTRQQ